MNDIYIDESTLNYILKLLDEAMSGTSPRSKNKILKEAKEILTELKEN